MNRSRFLKRVKELGAKVGLDSERAIGLAAGLGPDLLRKLRTGKNQGLKADTMAKLASALGTSVDDLMEAADLHPPVRVIGAVSAPVDLVPVVGELQAGAWREAEEWPPAQQYRLTLPADPRYPKAKRFGLKLIGDSMNLLYPLPDTIVLCVRLLDLDEPPASGKVVVVQRKRHDLMEATCKVFIERDGEAWLESRSNNASYKPVRLVRTKKELTEAARLKQSAVAQAGDLAHFPANMDSLEITALVTGSYTQQ